MAVVGIIFVKTVLPETTFAHHAALKVIFRDLSQKQTKHRSELNQTESASAIFLASAVTKNPPVSLVSATLTIVIAGIKTRALLDSGASRNFIDTLFVKSLGLNLVGSSEKIAMAYIRSIAPRHCNCRY